MPYLHWETNARRRRSLASSITSSAPTRNKGVEGRLLPTTYDIGVKPYGSKPNPSTLLEVAEGATEVRERLHLKRHTKPRTILGRVFLRAAALYEAMNCFSDQEILDKYLQMDPPLHPRRSLNQYRLWSSGKRDTDQVVYRETHSPARSRFYERGLDESKLLMVDQLWLWILDGSKYLVVLRRHFRTVLEAYSELSKPCLQETPPLFFFSQSRSRMLTNNFVDTIITSFPRRYGRNPDDPSSISRRIRSRLKNVREGEIKTAYDIALLVLDECSKTIFEPKRNPHDQKPELIDIFQNAIIRLVKVCFQC
jgi:hypothetical protein